LSNSPPPPGWNQMNWKVVGIEFWVGWEMGIMVQRILEIS